MMAAASSSLPPMKCAYRAAMSVGAARKRSGSNSGSSATSDAPRPPMAWRSAATAGRIAILPTTSCLFEEAADEIAGGAGGDLGRRRELLHLAVVEERNAIGEREGFLVIVGDEDRSEAKLVVDLAQ